MINTYCGRPRSTAKQKKDLHARTETEAERNYKATNSKTRDSRSRNTRLRGKSIFALPGNGAHDLARETSPTGCPATRTKISMQRRHVMAKMREIFWQTVGRSSENENNRSLETASSSELKLNINGLGRFPRNGRVQFEHDKKRGTHDKKR